MSDMWRRSVSEGAIHRLMLMTNPEGESLVVMERSDYYYTAREERSDGGAVDINDDYNDDDD